jgi:hypothetical protein
MIRSSLLDTSAIKDSIEICFIFFEWYYIFYVFLKFI